MTIYAIRYFVDFMVSDFHVQFCEYVAQNSVRYFYARHNTDKPHYHWCIETSLKEQAMRSFIGRRKKNSSQKGVYSCVLDLKKSEVEYGSYVMYKKKESQEVTVVGFTEDEIERMKQYSEQFKDITVTGKKSESFMSKLIRDLPYNTLKDEEVNFNLLIDYLIDNRQVNMFTTAKIRSIYMMWMMNAYKEHHVDKYVEFRQQMLRNMKERNWVTGELRLPL